MGGAMEDVKLEMSTLRRQLEVMSEAQAAMRFTVEDIYMTVAQPGATSTALEPRKVVEVPCPWTPISCRPSPLQPGTLASGKRSRSLWCSEPSREPSRMSCGPSEEETADMALRIVDSVMAVVSAASSIYIAANMDMSDGSTLWVGLDSFSR